MKPVFAPKVPPVAEIMNPDAPVCLCFHVSRRKITNFIRIEKPKRPSQLSECFGAGTGCGWCIPYLEQLLANASSERQMNSQIEPSVDLDTLTAEEYSSGREKYVRAGHGQPPISPPPGGVKPS